MSSRTKLGALLNGASAITAYLEACSRKNLTEDEAVHVPPKPTELQTLITYLRQQGLRPTIIGSVGLLHYLKGGAEFRPTVDVDIFVARVPKLLSGWRVDPTSPGVISWISPTGGYVDFLTPGHAFPGGGATPSSVETNPSTASSSYPVASWKSLMKLKLDSTREKDLLDVIFLVRSLGRMPEISELGKLNSMQKENYQTVETWFKLRPHGKYGE